MKKVLFLLILSSIALGAPSVYAATSYSARYTASPPLTGSIGGVTLASAKYINNSLYLAYYSGASTGSGTNLYSPNAPTITREVCSSVQYFYTDDSSTNQNGELLYRNLNEPSNFLTTLPRDSTFIPYAATNNATSCINGIYFDNNWASSNIENAEFSIKPMSNTAANGKNVLVFQVDKNNLPLRNVLVQLDIEYQYYAFTEPAAQTVFYKNLSSNADGRIVVQLSNKQDNDNDNLTVSFKDQLGTFGYSASYPITMSPQKERSARAIGYVISALVCLLLLVIIYILLKRRKHKTSANNVSISSHHPLDSNAHHGGNY